jgi:predicted HTH domain antitoxin
MLSEGIREYKLKEALEILRERKITIWRAVEMVSVTYMEILDGLKQYNIPFPSNAQGDKA